MIKKIQIRKLVNPLILNDGWVGFQGDSEFESDGGFTGLGAWSYLDIIQDEQTLAEIKNDTFWLPVYDIDDEITITEMMAKCLIVRNDGGAYCVVKFHYHEPAYDWYGPCDSMYLPMDKIQQIKEICDIGPKRSESLYSKVWTIIEDGKPYICYGLEYAIGANGYICWDTYTKWSPEAFRGLLYGEYNCYVDEDDMQALMALFEPHNDFFGIETEEIEDE